MAFLNEIVKSFLGKNTQHKEKSSVVNPNHVKANLSNDNDILNFTDFFDNENRSWGGCFNSDDLVQRQADKIRSYRQCAQNSEVSNALDIIVNEIVFSYDGFPLKLNYNETNQKLQSAVSNAFDKIVKLGNFSRNLYKVVRDSYIDGQLIFHLSYDKDNTKNGIQELRYIDPCGLYYDYTTKTWKYKDASHSTIYYSTLQNEEFSNEEIVRFDFGMYQDNICLSYLEMAIKNANMLKTLEDLLIPLRFSRSMSRRVFNIDIGDLPQKRGEEYMRKVQEAFKYKKFYNNDTGEVSNQQHITSMVEDYWFANRSGGKGTTVETLDESGNLGEITDIIYLNKKLYRSLRIPMSKLDIDTDSDHHFAVDTTDTTQEDLKFMIFISRVRVIYTELFKEILKREVIATNIMRESEWKERQHDINIEFISENLFIEKMKQVLLKNKFDLWSEVKELGGNIIPMTELIHKVFGYNEQEIIDNLKAIEKEKKNKHLKKLYGEQDGNQEQDMYGMGGMPNTDNVDTENLDDLSQMLS